MWCLQTRWYSTYKMSGLWQIFMWFLFAGKWYSGSVCNVCFTSICGITFFLATWNCGFTIEIWVSSVFPTFFSFKQFCLREIPLKLSMQVWYSNNKVRDIAYHTLAFINLGINNKCVPCIYSLFLLCSHTCVFRMFDHLIDLFMKWVVHPSRMHEIHVDDIWSFIDFTWNSSDFTRNVSKQEMSEYLIMRFQYGCYIPIRSHLSQLS